MQRTLFDKGPPPSPPPFDGWKRIPGRYTPNVGQRYELHRAGKYTGWHVDHCGHPTANFPYAVYDPHGQMHIQPGRRFAFQTVREAKAYAELLEGTT